MKKLLLALLLSTAACTTGIVAQAIAPQLPPNYHAIEAPWYYRHWYYEVEQCVRTTAPELYTPNSDFEDLRWYKVPGLGWNSAYHKTWIDGAYYDYNESIYTAELLNSEEEKEIVKHEVMHYFLRDMRIEDTDHPRPPYGRCERL